METELSGFMLMVIVLYGAVAVFTDISFYGLIPFVLLTFALVLDLIKECL